MARRRKALKRPLLEEYLGILRIRFPAVTFTLHEWPIDGKPTFQVEVTMGGFTTTERDRGVFGDLYYCLFMLQAAHGNVGYSIQ